MSGNFKDKIQKIYETFDMTQPSCCGIPDCGDSANISGSIIQVQPEIQSPPPAEVTAQQSEMAMNNAVGMFYEACKKMQESMQGLDEATAREKLKSFITKHPEMEVVKSMIPMITEMVGQPVQSQLQPVQQINEPGTEPTQLALPVTPPTATYEGAVKKLEGLLAELAKAYVPSGGVHDEIYEAMARKIFVDYINKYKQQDGTLKDVDTGSILKEISSIFNMNEELTKQVEDIFNPSQDLPQTKDSNPFSNHESISDNDPYSSGSSDGSKNPSMGTDMPSHIMEYRNQISKLFNK